MNSQAKQKRSITVLLLAGCFSFPSCSSPDRACSTDTSTVQILCSANPQRLSHFPADWYSVEDATSLSGRRLALPETGLASLTDALSFMGVARSTAMLNQLDGFSTVAPIIIPLSGNIQTSTLPQNPSDSIKTTSSVFLAQWSDQSLSYEKKIPIHVGFKKYLDLNPPKFLLTITPEKPLLAKTRYALAITRALLAEDGSPLGSSLHCQMALDQCNIPTDTLYHEAIAEEQDRLAPLFNKPLLLKKEQLVSAFSFTTQSVQDEITAMRDILYTDQYQDAKLNFDCDHDQNPDLYTIENFPGSPGPTQKSEFIGLIVRGCFEAPQFRNSAGQIQVDSFSVPEVVNIENVSFLLILPKDSEFQPFPLVFFQHGFNSQKENVLYAAGYFAERGIAVIAIDLVEQGQRKDTGTGHGFLNLTDLTITRASFEQSAVDLMRLLQLIKNNLQIDFVPNGTGDQIEDLDFSKTMGVGESAGAMVLTIVTALEPDLKAAVLNVVGAGFKNMVQHYLGGLLQEESVLQMQILAQTLTDRGDAINFYRPLLPHLEIQPAKQLLLQEVIDDMSISNLSTEDLSRTIECPLVKPFKKEIPGLITVAAPTSKRGLFQYQPAKHGFLLSVEDDPAASHAVRHQVTQFVDSFFKTGVGTIEVP